MVRRLAISQILAVLSKDAVTILVPSGEKMGSVSTPIPLVSCLASPPARPTIHRSPAKTKTICDWFDVGCCNKRGFPAWPSPMLADAANNKIANKIDLIISLLF